MRPLAALRIAALAASANLFPATSWAQTPRPARPPPSPQAVAKEEAFCAKVKSYGKMATDGFKPIMGGPYPNFPDERLATATLPDALECFLAPQDRHPDRWVLRCSMPSQPEIVRRQAKQLGSALARCLDAPPDMHDYEDFTIAFVRSEGVLYSVTGIPPSAGETQALVVDIEPQP